MKIADYPKTLPRAEQYTPVKLAILFGVTHRTACKFIDSGLIEGFTVPGSRERRVLHSALETFVAANPGYKFVLKKLTSEGPKKS